MSNQEKDFEAQFPLIRKRCGAYLFRLYPPTRCVGMRGSMPTFALTGRALYDVAGWMPLERIEYPVDETGLAMPHTLGRAIGIELKETGKAHTSLRIVGDDGSGSGLQAHQLEALAALHRDGGLAKLLWNNGGESGVLDGEYIAKAFFDYGVSVAAERAGKKPAVGARSIPWTLFRHVKDEEPESVVVMPKREPTMRQQLAANKHKAQKDIDESFEE